MNSHSLTRRSSLLFQPPDARVWLGCRASALHAVCPRVVLPRAQCVQTAASSSHCDTGHVCAAGLECVACMQGGRHPSELVVGTVQEASQVVAYYAWLVRKCFFFNQPCTVSVCLLFSLPPPPPPFRCLFFRQCCSCAVCMPVICSMHVSSKGLNGREMWEIIIYTVCVLLVASGVVSFPRSAVVVFFFFFFSLVKDVSIEAFVVATLRKRRPTPPACIMSGIGAKCKAALLTTFKFRAIA